MACSLKTGFWVSGSNEIELKTKRIFGFCPSVGSLQISESKSTNPPVLKSEFRGRTLNVSNAKDLGFKSLPNFSPRAEESFCVRRARRWWEKTPKPNMIEIKSAQELVDSLLNAGDKLVIIDFYSPGCGGCRTLHSKMCQIAESNPDAIFLKVNYEELNTMCRVLNIRVLPFFRFYRGAEGHLCSFSCTNATIMKFKNALVKHGTDRCSLGPTKGIDESELLNLASNGEIKIDIPSRSIRKEIMKDLIISNINISYSSCIAEDKKERVKEEDALLIV